MVNYAFKVADAIHYQNGMIHGEYMIDDKGPVLIEVNCRAMGCSQPAEYMDLITGQHETDSLLDTLLYPENFEKKMTEPYRLLRKGFKDDHGSEGFRGGESSYLGSRKAAEEHL